MKNIINNTNKGYITLISVLVIGAVGLAISISLISLGLGASLSGFSYVNSSQAKALANACAEEALEQIRESTSYTGTGGLTIGAGSCTYTVTSQGAESRTISASGVINSATRNVSVIINVINPRISVVSWQEV